MRPRARPVPVSLHRSLHRRARARIVRRSGVTRRRWSGGGRSVRRILHSPRPIPRRRPSRRRGRTAQARAVHVRGAHTRSRLLHGMAGCHDKGHCHRSVAAVVERGHRRSSRMSARDHLARLAVMCVALSLAIINHVCMVLRVLHSLVGPMFRCVPFVCGERDKFGGVNLSMRGVHRALRRA